MGVLSYENFFRLVFILSMRTLLINPKSIFTIWRRKVLRHSFSRQDTHTTNFHRFLSGWIGPFDRILPIFLFTQMHNGPSWNKNFAHKECWLYLYTLTKILRWDISFLKFSLVGLEFLKNFFFALFLEEKKLPAMVGFSSQSIAGRVSPSRYFAASHTDYSQKIIKDCNSFTRRNPTCVCDCKIPECFRSFYPMHTAGWN